MCLAIPGKVISIEGSTGIVELGGVKRRTSLQLVPEASPGQYVLVHAGYAIQVIDENEARETLALFDEYFATLEEGGGERR
jgi:hydrogenase expression/formation protein HypC